MRSVARQPADRPARPQQRRQQQQRRAARRLHDHRHRAGRGRLPHRLRGQVPQRLPQASAPSKYDPPGWAEFDVINCNQGKYFWYQIRDRDGNITPAQDRRGRLLHRRHRRHRGQAHPAGSRRRAAVRAHRAVHARTSPTCRRRGTRATRAARTSSRGRHRTTTRRTSRTSPPTSRRQKPLADDGFDLTAHCESLLAVDELIGRVRRGARGARAGSMTRSSSSSADNGMTWGEHRRVAKVSPYATAMPAYAAWPAGRGTEPRDDATTLSMIDFAPTFCELGGCEMGPYPNGQEAADGLSFASLLADEPLPYLRESLLHTVPVGRRPSGVVVDPHHRRPPRRALALHREPRRLPRALRHQRWALLRVERGPAGRSLRAGEPARRRGRARGGGTGRALSAELAELKVEVAPSCGLEAGGRQAGDRPTRQARRRAPARCRRGAPRCRRTWASQSTSTRGRPRA